MSGRKTKTERKKAADKGEEPQVFFEDVLLAFLRNVGQAVGGIKNRGGAQSLGPDGMFACATEALDLARNGANVQGYISASAYALVAAMQQGGAWNLPPKPASEQPPEPEETPSAPPESKGKGKSKGRGKQWT